ncbi:hypothetical protein HDV05_001398 [Chytridiales sp. JEL 0842]|nr:hypothetical protein HDV05_001398 [Chytridiales sp. JEL 0842]
MTSRPSGKCGQSGMLLTSEFDRDHDLLTDRHQQTDVAISPIKYLFQPSSTHIQTDYTDSYAVSAIQREDIDSDRKLMAHAFFAWKMFVERDSRCKRLAFQALRINALSTRKQIRSFQSQRIMYKAFLLWKTSFAVVRRRKRHAEVALEKFKVYANRLLRTRSLKVYVAQ